MNTLVMPDTVWTELTATLSETLETAGLLFASVIEAGSGNRRLLVQRLRLAPDESYLDRTPTEVSLASGAYMPYLSEPDVIPIFFHTHPGGDPTPSVHDDRVDELLRPVFQVRAQSELYVSLVLGGTVDEPRISGRVYTDSEAPGPLDRAVVVGEGLRVTSLTGLAVEQTTGGRFGRQILAFGEAGQRLLGTLTVGVIGAGGTGSAVGEQVTRLGVGKVLVVDIDDVDDSNMTRIHESSIEDVGRPKTQVMADAARRSGSNTDVVPIAGMLWERKVARQLVDCDIIFGCTDDNAGRAVLSRLAYSHLIPVLDMGFTIRTESHGIGLFGRLTRLSPGTACLWCRSRLDARLVAIEQLDPEQRAALVAEGYAPDLAIPNPSVIPYTTLIASLAVQEMLDLLFGITASPRPSETLLALHDRRFSFNSTPPSAGHYCADASFWGRGNREPFLGQLWAD